MFIFAQTILFHTDFDVLLYVKFKPAYDIIKVNRSIAKYTSSIGHMIAGMCPFPRYKLLKVPSMGKITRSFIRSHLK